jgi:O-antigen/teichoic acid export membrane protein
MLQAKFKRLAKDSVIYGIGGVAIKFIGFLLLPIYTRVFSPTDYGIMDMIATMVALAGIILSSGTETALSYYFFQLNNDLERQKTITSITFYLILIHGLVSVGIYIFAESITRFVFGEESFGSFLKIAALSIPFSSLVSLNLNLLRLLRRPWSYVALTTGQLVVTIILNVYLVIILRIGVSGVFWTNLLTSVLFSVISSLQNWKYFSLYSLDLPRLWEVIRYGAPLIIGGLSMWSINFLDRYFLLHFATIEEVGLYSVGMRLASAIAFITWAFRLANAPFQFEVSRDNEASQIYSRTFYYYVLSITTLAIALTVFARPALQILTTESYVAAAPIVGLAAFSAGAYGLYQIVGVGLLVTKKTGFVGTALGLGALLNICFLFVLVPQFGTVGAGVAVLLTHIVVVVILYRAGQRAYPIPYDLNRVARILIPVPVIILLENTINSYSIWSDIIISTSLFGVFMLFLVLVKAIDPEIVRIIRKSLKNTSYAMMRSK